MSVGACFTDKITNLSQIPGWAERAVPRQSPALGTRLRVWPLLFVLPFESRLLFGILLCSWLGQ